jgi:hypothetical protein
MYLMWFLKVLCQKRAFPFSGTEEKRPFPGEVKAKTKTKSHFTFS